MLGFSNLSLHYSMIYSLTDNIVYLYAKLFNITISLYSPSSSSNSTSSIYKISLTPLFLKSVPGSSHSRPILTQSISVLSYLLFFSTFTSSSLSASFSLSPNCLPSTFSYFYQLNSFYFWCSI